MDIERVKNDIAIADLIGQTYTVTGRGHTLTTVEHDSLKIFTNTNSWTWYSQSGRNGKTLGGSAIDWVMHRDKCDCGGAIRTLTALLDGQPVEQRLAAQPAKQPDAWLSPDWQEKARHELERAQNVLLNAPEGQPGRDYLEQRAIRLDMALAWGLGYRDAWNKKANRAMPAIWIPYQNRRITAIQYRFLGIAKDDATADRFGQLKGGKRYLCGLHLCYDPADPTRPVFGPSVTVNVSEPLPPGEPGQLGTLFLVEGELNAVSIYQAIYGMYPADVVSFGSQANINNADVARMAATVASRYKRVIVWTDEPENAVKALNGLPATTRRLAVRSPGGMDANDLLKAGKLDDVVFELIRKATGLQ